MKEFVRRELLLSCPPEHAFAVFTERVDGWWPQSHRRREGSRIALEPGTGGILAEHTDDGEALEIGRVVTWDPPNELRFTWRLGAPANAHSLVRVRFTTAAGKTQVEVLHTDSEAAPLPDFATTARIFGKAWTHLLEEIDRYIQAHPVEDPA